MKIFSFLILMFSIFIYGCKDENDQVVTATDSASFLDMQSVFDKMMVEIDTMTMTGDPDYDFAMMMIPHHQGAIEISEILINTGHHDSLKNLAQSGMMMQQESITRLRGFIISHTPSPIADQSYMMQMSMSMKKMHNKVDTQHSHNDTDVDFCSIMVEHHQGAIDNARLVLEYGNDDQMKEEARKTIEEQEKEILELSEFLKKH